MAVSDQVPVKCGFGSKSTGAEVLADHTLAGKVAIVTGGYSGIGLETVRTHVNHIYQKLHVRSRTEAVVKYLRQGS